MSIDFAQVLAEKRELVWYEIEKALNSPLNLPQIRQVPEKYEEDLKFHWKILRDYPERKGKYLRPALVLLTAQAMGFPQGQALKTAAAMQLSEDWILIHDDFEDDSLERRGKPALHRLYGNELAVNAGDGLHVLMWKILKDNFQMLGEQKASEIFDEFYQILMRTVLGQTTEIKWTQDKRTNLTDEDCFFLLDGKTVYYTIAGPMRLGAILAGANFKQLETLYRFAQPLGRCFQIKDDLLDLTSDFAGLKKQKGNDIFEGKRTIMLMHLFRNTDISDKEKLVQIMEKKREEKTEEEVMWILEMMEKYGSLDYGQKLAASLASEALEVFEKDLDFLSEQPARDQLKAGIDFVLERKY